VFHIQFNLGFFMRKCSPKTFRKQYLIATKKGGQAKTAEKISAVLIQLIGGAKGDQPKYQPKRAYPRQG